MNNRFKQQIEFIREIDKIKDINADIAIGTDPDADRIGIAVNHKGSEVYLSGNQLGILMMY